MRISSSLGSLAALSMLAACQVQPTTAVTNQAATADEGDEHIDCAHGDAPLQRVCTVDRLESDHGLVLTVRHPDGAFHRLLVTRDGRGVIAADGAQRAAVTIDGADLIDVAIGGDRYQLPATVKPRAS